MAEGALDAARQLASAIAPGKAAERAGCVFEGDEEAGVFRVGFLGEEVSVTYPEFEVMGGAGPIPPHVAALLVYYLGTTDGTAPEGRWVSFAELPDGSFYSRAFRGYTGELLAARFGDDFPALGAAAATLGGAELAGLADAAWRLVALPRVPLAVLWWASDEEFPARADILFDSSATRHLPLDGCAVLGSWVTARLARAHAGQA